MIGLVPKQEGPINGVIYGRDGNGYMVRTGSGRTIRAASGDVWMVGTPVVVLSGQIIGRGGWLPPEKIYEV